MGHRPALIITVDTEADNEWQATGAASYENIKWLSSFQSACEAYGAKPTYLVTHDVVAQADCAKTIVDVTQGENAEIGAHMHPWSTPPLEVDAANRGKPYLYEYPLELQEAKLKCLTETIATYTGVRPTAYRAGRWGLGEAGRLLLEQAGYKVDSSVLPLIDFTYGSRGRSVPGPNYLNAPLLPYRPAKENICQQGDGRLLEVPVTTGIIGPMASFSGGFLKTGGRLGDYFRRGIRKIRAAQIVKLTPVRYELEPMLKLVDVLSKQGAPVFNIALHSSEWVAGFSPTIPDKAAEEALHRRMEALLERLAPMTRSMTLSQFADEWQDSHTPAPVADEQRVSETVM